MAALKVFRYTAYNYKWARALEQPRHIGQVGALIATNTQKKAAEAFGVTIGEFRKYGGETGNDQDREIALAHPEEVIIRPLDHPRERYLLVKDIS